MVKLWRTPLAWGLVPVLMWFGVGCSGTSRDASPMTDRVYHVQVGMAKDKSQADRTLGRAITWWKAHADAVNVRPLSSETESPVSLVWKAPLYRVRLGPFRTAREAERVLASVDSTFPEAFVAPSRRSGDGESR